MAGLLYTLTKRQRMALPIIERAVREGLSANRIQKLLREQGMGIRRQVLLDIVRHVKGVELTKPVLKALRPDRAPNPARLPTAVTKLLRPYAFKVRLTYRDVETGERRTEYVTVATDRVMTRREIEGVAARLARRTRGLTMEDLEDVELESGVRAGELGTIL